MKRLTAFCATILTLATTAALAVECNDITYDGNRYTVCEATAREDLRLFLRDDTGKILGHFSAVDRSLPAGKSLTFAMNAGMYHADRSPVGFYVEEAQTEGSLLTGASSGNFGLLPNGVFCIGDARVDVVETLRFKDKKPACKFASQSGPMLVIEGQLHPRFLVDSTSRFIRNGVGTSADGQRVVFAISKNAVTFHEFGRLFQDALDLPNALYFDGKVSRLYAPQINRNDAGFWLGPIVGIVDDQ